MRRVFALLLATAGTVVLASGLALEADAPGDHPPAPAHLAQQAGAPAAVEPASRPGGRDAGLVRDLRWRNIGPANMAGRVTDIEALESGPGHRARGRRLGRCVQVDQRRHHLGTDLRPLRHARRSATSPSSRRTRTSSGSAPASRASATASAGVTACTSRPTAASRSPTSASRDTHHISEVVTHPTDPEHRLRGRAGAPLGPHGRARPLQDDRRRQDAGSVSPAACRTTAGPARRT